MKTHSNSEITKYKMRFQKKNRMETYLFVEDKMKKEE